MSKNTNYEDKKALKNFIVTLKKTAVKFSGVFIRFS